MCKCSPFPSCGGVAGSAWRGGYKMRHTKNFLSLPFNPTLKKRAKELRQVGHLAEVLLWKQIKNKQFFNLDFDRQKIIGNYIVDFYCAEKGVVIEIDGCSHDEKVEYDAGRDVFLKSLNLTVIHISDSDVRHHLADVMVFLQHQLAVD